MASPVSFIDFRKVKKSLLYYIDNAFTTVAPTFFSKGAITAVKVHMGETGNTTYIRPLFVRRIVENIKKQGAKPFLTDTSTLYVGDRSNAVDYLNAAVYNGFGYDAVGCPIIISDGVKSNNSVKVDTPDSKHFKYIRWAGDVAAADQLVVVSHVKGHVVAGFGGALKNASMGLATRSTKQQMHGDVKPRVNEQKCTGCATCVKYCPVKAITITAKKAVFDHDICIGCADCIAVCPFHALKILWNENQKNFLEKLTEVAANIVKNYGKPVLYINFISDITPDCDCMDYSQYPITSDVGILFSNDPVAIDQASCDLIKKEALFFTDAGANHSDHDKFSLLHPEIDYAYSLEYAEKLGLGSREYTLNLLN